MSDTPLKISGELTHDPAVCLFHLDRPVVENLTMIFDSKESGGGSPLVDSLFGVAGVAKVMVSGETLTVTKSADTPWPQLAGQIAQAIREGMASGAPITQAAMDEIRNAPMEGVEQAIADLFEEHINPALSSHGGYVRLVKVEGRDVHVEMGGGCQGCASSRMTLKYGVESAIRRIAPQVGSIVDVTDHTAGANPFFT
jgi:NFU1 iron-sulfur cluster scaffold homolog, mitochondrial